jgi:hypothetical protein
VRDHYLSKETLPINQIASMIIRSGPFGNSPMPLDQFCEALCVANEKIQEKDESVEDEKNEISDIEID